MKHLFTFILLLTSLVFFSQESKNIIVYGKVVYYQFGDIVPIEGASVYEHQKKIAATNEDGEFTFEFNATKDLSLQIKAMGFENASREMLSKKLNRKIVNDTLFLPKIVLKDFIFNEVVITANKVDTVFGHQAFSVEDFEVLPDKRLLLLGYNRSETKLPQAILTDKKHDVIFTLNIPVKANELFRDYAGNYYVECEDVVYMIKVYMDELRLYKVDLNEYYSYYKRVIDTLEENYYYSDYNELYPAVKFYSTKIGDTVPDIMYEVKDDFMMELYRAQYKYVSGRDKLWAFRKELETGIDKEIWIGAASFTQDILYKPVYAPLFVINDSIMIFDTYKDRLLFYDNFNDSLGHVQIQFHNSKRSEKWEKPLLVDKGEQQVYAVFNSAGYFILKTINRNTGHTGTGFKVTNQFVERIQIIDGYVYYIYRPYESSQKKFIYKEKIK